MQLVRGPHPVLTETADHFILRDGGTRTVVYKASGGIWSEDTTLHWNPKAHPTLLQDSMLLGAAAALVRGGHPLADSSADSGFVHFPLTGYGGSYVKRLKRSTGTIGPTTALDRQLNLGARIRIRTGLFRNLTATTTGGGGNSRSPSGIMER